MTIYTAWGSADGSVFAFHEGEGRPTFVDGTPDPDVTELVCRFEADSYNEAMQKYYDLQGWGEYRPMEED